MLIIEDASTLVVVMHFLTLRWEPSEKKYSVKWVAHSDNHTSLTGLHTLLMKCD